MAKLNWNTMLSKNSFSINFMEFNSIVNPKYVKDLRIKLNFSQKMFANILGISEKTVEKWEQGANPVKGTASRLLFLLNKYDYLIDELYTVNNSICDVYLYETRYQIKTVKIKKKSDLQNFKYMSIDDNVSSIHEGLNQEDLNKNICRLY